ncbi:hypothetical protein GCM10010411_75890 [Actinomadura fulvescens]|uniref:Uncharacterized protein n=1 Tax=Actinomadura fulvescens TaxID=46160 RepID=A0ABP6CVM7_9ACTN
MTSTSEPIDGLTLIDGLTSEALQAAMTEAIAAARSAAAPFGAVLLDLTDGSIVARAGNAVENGDPTAHAEMRVLRTMNRLSTPAAQYALASTAEPCPMCTAAAVFAGVGAIYYGTSIATLIALGWPQLDLPARELTSNVVPASYAPVVVGGVREAECDTLYTHRADAALAQQLARARDPRPPGHHALTPYLAVPDVHEAIAYYQAAFDARELLLVHAAENIVYHAEIVIPSIRDTVIALHEDLPGTARARPPQTIDGTTVTLTLWVNDVDAAFSRAITAGGCVDSPPENTYWGTRMARFRCPAGHGWTLAHQLLEVSSADQNLGAQAHLAAHPLTSLAGKSGSHMLVSGSS